ncbi:MAG: hypothetical protein AAGB93_00690 [Planctomycetota bacterium]
MSENGEEPSLAARKLSQAKAREAQRARAHLTGWRRAWVVSLSVWVAITINTFLDFGIPRSRLLSLIGATSFIMFLVGLVKSVGYQGELYYLTGHRRRDGAREVYTRQLEEEAEGEESLVDPARVLKRGETQLMSELENTRRRASRLLLIGVFLVLCGAVSTVIIASAVDADSARFGPLLAGSAIAQIVALFVFRMFAQATRDTGRYNARMLYMRQMMAAWAMEQHITSVGGAKRSRVLDASLEIVAVVAPSIFSEPAYRGGAGASWRSKLPGGGDLDGEASIE